MWIGFAELFFNKVLTNEWKSIKFVEQLTEVRNSNMESFRIVLMLFIVSLKYRFVVYNHQLIKIKIIIWRCN